MPTTRHSPTRNGLMLIVPWKRPWTGLAAYVACPTPPPDTHTHTRARTHMPTPMHAYTHTRAHTCTLTAEHACTCTPTPPCMYAFAFAVAPTVTLEICNNESYHTLGRRRHPNHRCTGTTRTKPPRWSHTPRRRVTSKGAPSQPAYKRFVPTSLCDFFARVVGLDY